VTMSMDAMGDPGHPVPPWPEVLDPVSRQGLEALLFLTDEPLGVDALADVIDHDPERIEAALEALAASYRADGRGIEVRRAAGGWRMYTAAGARPVLERWALLGRTGRLTQAALETLAVIVYKQPIGRQEISDIRGVNADAAVRSLVARGFVREVGRDPGPGQATLFGTTPVLLERLGIDSLDEMPPLTDHLPEAPAPDEPELGAFKEVRRRLAAGEELPSRSLGGRSALQTNTGQLAEEPDDEDVLPAPTGHIGQGRQDERMDDLTERLERAARSAVGRLRAAVAAGDGAPPDDEEPAASDGDPADADGDPADGDPADADGDPVVSGDDGPIDPAASAPRDDRG
jgi:segregation and condensation protein B